MQDSNRKLILAGLLAGILMAAMDNTIVVTAMGTIIGELGGMDKFTLVASAYMTTELAGMLIYGKLADIYGRKPFYLAGLCLFMGGSLLCANAHTMVQLYLYRALQGMGAGALVPLAYTIIFDVVPQAERGKIAGLFGAVFGLSSILGPILGAYLTDYVGWRWIFYINVPLGLVSFILLLRFYHEDTQHLGQDLDWPGALFLITSIVSLMAFLQRAGGSQDPSSLPVDGLLISFILFMALFIYQERRSANPVLPLELFRGRLFAASQGVGFFYCAVYIPVAIYIPIYVQGVFGGTATSAGGVLAPMMLASVAGSQFAGRKAIGTSYRRLMLISCLLFFSGILSLGTLNVSSPRWLLTMLMIITGLGMGFSWSVLSMASNHGLEYRQRASANSTLSFSQTLGMTLGISILGALQNFIMRQSLNRAFQGPDLAKMSQDARVLLQPVVRDQFSPEALNTMSGILANSITTVFHYSLLFIIIALVFIIMMGSAGLNASQAGDTVSRDNEFS